jgi:hypothetical protein
VCAGVLNLQGSVEHCSVVDPYGVGVVVFDQGAVHERAEVTKRLVVQVAAGDAVSDGRGERGRDVVSR